MARARADALPVVWHGFRWHGASGASSGGTDSGQFLMAIPEGANMTLTMRWLPGGLAIHVTISNP